MVVQTFGDLYAIGLDVNTLNSIYWSFLNLGLIAGEIYWLNQNFGYFFCAKKKFEKWLEISSRRIYENIVGENVEDMTPTQKKKASKEVEKIKEEKQKNIRWESFIEKTKGGGMETYKLSGIRADASSVLTY